MAVTRHEITTRRVVYRLAEEDGVQVQRGIAYGSSRVMDLFRPTGCTRAARKPAVVLVNGYSDPRAQATLGCRVMEMASFESWARLAAASGLAAVTYSTGEDPASDLRTLFAFLRQEAAELNVNGRFGVWACSGHVPTALAALIEERASVKCGVLCYGYTLGPAVAEAAAQFGFANPTAGKTVADLPLDVPLLVIKAANDAMPNLNDALDAFVAAARERRLSITTRTHPSGPHAFDLLDDSDESREIVKTILAFMRSSLLAAADV